MVTSTPFTQSFQVPTLPPEGRHLDRVNTEISRLEKYLDDLISKNRRPCDANPTSRKNG